MKKNFGGKNHPKTIQTQTMAAKCLLQHNRATSANMVFNYAACPHKLVLGLYDVFV